MAILAKSGGTSSPVPAGVFHAVCYSCVDLGTQPTQNSNFPARRKVAILFELPHERGNFPDKQGVSRNLPRAISYINTLSLSDKANLRRDLQSWRGKPFTAEELKGFDLKNLIGVNAQINVVHAQKGDKTYANIAGIMPLMKGTEKLKPENPTLYFDLDEWLKLGVTEFPANMPDWLITKVKQSDEYLAAQDGNRGSPDHPENGGENHSQAVDESEVPF